MKKFYLLFIVAAVIALAGCSKKSDSTTTDPAVHLAQVNKAITGSWNFQYVHVLLSNTTVIADTVTNIYNVSFDGTQTMTAKQVVNGNPTGTTVSVTYKLTSFLANDYVVFYDSSNNIIDQCQVTVPGGVSGGTANKMSLIMHHQSQFYPLVYDPSTKTNYTDTEEVFYAR